MNEAVYLVRWVSAGSNDEGILGIFSSKYFAEEAIKNDAQEYPCPEYDMEYAVEYFILDEVD